MAMITPSASLAVGSGGRVFIKLPRFFDSWLMKKEAGYIAILRSIRSRFSRTRFVHGCNYEVMQ
jgi:hypothetical protein